ncbi:ISC1 [Brettanomyces bruxellensis]|uniref:DEBR0S2_05314g1_1 n=1 Tax=Dekkera bruxellensis TaxID=5007 RepID=A0A7D9CXY1_DEKBR|nr:ISC1 [Brettanomyces bruxellensis]
MAKQKEEFKFKLLTFNIWGLKYVSHFRKERLHAVANRLASGDDALQTDNYDIVALQEVWCQDDWDYIDRVCALRYPYRRWFSSGMISGPGLAVLSRFPIVETFLYRYAVNGRPSAFYRGDWYVGKSASVTILEPTGSGHRIALVNSHMHAPYALTGDAAYECHRTTQAWDLAGLTTRLKNQGYGVILVGDLNSRPGTLPHRILSSVGKLKDSWLMLHEPLPLSKIALMSPSDQVKLAGTTCDSTINTWRASRAPTEACRLDYAFVGGDMLTAVDASVVFTERIPGIGSYSDHFAYTATFKVTDKQKPCESRRRTSPHSRKKITGNTSDATVSVLSIDNETRSQIDETSVHNYPATHEDPLSVCKDARITMSNYLLTTSKKQRFWRFFHFVVSMVLFIAFIPVIIVVSYQAPWASVIFYIIGCLITVSGVIDGLISFLFGRHEQRALKEEIMQIDDRIRYIQIDRNEHSDEGSHGY